jgi:alkaline phosphatase D
MTVPDDLDGLAFEVDVEEDGDPAAFAFDPEADPDATFPQSVASGGPTPTGCTPGGSSCPPA